VLGERDEDLSHNAEPVGSSVQGQVDPTVGVPLPGRRGEVGRVREDAVEGSDAPGEVRDDDLEGKPLRPGRVREAQERREVPVGGDDRPP
jgi:hypothetical protein